MTAIIEKYGMSKRAIIILPILGAFLVNIFYQPATVGVIKTLVKGLVQ
ncbi:Sodium/glutamate symport carrier protein [Fusobacterium vincentii ATCC 49256]|uniref:Sodium/glutamate symport carrier protein n=1 Tax=Fusobacterium vincentii ATCC 49256 TaxID=209882 RepID=Q7P3K8_FUSVC|nr:Sodium/glutamate symport carrier protein [Fusobacterium vincentii ATCC 49256]